MNYVIDMRHYDGLEQMTGKQYQPAQRFAGYMGAIVQAGTASPPGQVIRTPLACRRRPGRKPCPGRLLVRRSDMPPEITWECPSCDDQGVVYGYEGGIWDLGPPVAAGGVEVALKPDHYRALKAAALLEHDALRLVCAAQVHDDQIVMSGSSKELDELIDLLAAEANHTSSAKKRRLLDEVTDLIEAALP